MQTKSETYAKDVISYVKARASLVWIESPEEARIEQYIFEAAAAADYRCHYWDCSDGVTNLAGEIEQENMQDPGDILRFIGDNAKSGVSRDLWILRDFHAWTDGPGAAATIRQLKNLCRSLPSRGLSGAQSIIIISPQATVPAELESSATVISWPLPDRAEVESMIDATLANLSPATAAAALKSDRATIVDSCLGLTGEEAQGLINKSLVQNRSISASVLAVEKKRMIEKSGVLEYIEPIPGGLENVGGLEILKNWLSERSQAYSDKAREYGLPTPKGCVLVGVPGGGKSLTARAVATAWECPCVRIDLGALKSKFVGESESNLRRAESVIDSLGRVIVWIDEVEKALAGATQGAADGGVSTDALGSLLTWLQEREGQAFVVVTANDVSKLPPELLRKGRFDEIFFVDLATRVERIAIIKAALKKANRAALNVDLDSIAAATDGFTGAEIAELIPSALYSAFSDGERELETADILRAAADVVPLSVSQKERITELRAWASKRARRASVAEESAEPSSARGQLDL